MRISVVLALAALGFFVSGAQADSVEFDNVTNGGVIISPLLSGSAMSGWGYIGQYNWTVEQNGSALGPNGSHFFTFCIDITQDITFNGTYDYTLTNPANAPKPNSAYMNGPMGADNAAALGRLWSADIGNVVNATSVDNELEAAAAFQVAVWKITYNKSVDNLNTNDALDNLTIQLYTPDATLQNQINTDAFNWASAALNSSGSGTPLVALSSLTAQDQITFAPTPAAAIAGLALMAAMFALRLRNRRLVA
ncbi:MAG TPA: hypothetical protein VFW23_15880 [Tepidisphaeraceae bacterium]|nr:hypothetical protein [Tepidisphaeraceae bacterium]